MVMSKGYVDPEYLRMVGEMLGQLKQRTYEGMKLEPGHRVLDVGCGPGTDTIPLASLVGPTGEVFGVDIDEEMVSEANINAQGKGVNERVFHKHADATTLPFETGYYNSCRSERLFQHLQDPAAALTEMTQVTRKRGWIVVLDTDWGSGGIDYEDSDVERRMVRFHAEQMFHNGYAGRQLYRLFKQQGLLDVDYESFPVVVTRYPVARHMWTLDRTEREALAAGVVTEEELHQYTSTLEQADVDGVFFGYGLMTLVAGQKG